MLTYINIKDFAIIKDIELDLQSEMTAITGETGAGKSIIIDSLELALGARADASLVREGADRSEITLIFDLTNVPKAREWLIEKELDSENECIVRRVISSEGRSKSSINGHPCTQQILRTLSDFLLNIHGQHENQTLLNSDYQRELLDAFAANKDLVGEVKKLYKDWSKLKKELVELEALSFDQQMKLDFLTYRLEELEGVNCDAKNLEDLRTLHKKLSNVEQFSSGINFSLDAMADNDGATVVNNLYQIKSQLEECQKIDSVVNASIDLVNNAIIQVEEASQSLRQNLNDIEYDAEKQKQVENELNEIYTMARKHQVQPEGLQQVREDLEKQFEDAKNANANLEELRLHVEKASEDYLEKAKKLSSKRKDATVKLNKMVTEKMQVLGMEGGKFSVDLSKNTCDDFASHGLEGVEFLVSANPGTALQALNKVASGGELSRISLAIQVITAQKEVTPTIVFDEIDTGIGGKTADIVGRLLRKLAENTQVICITHLPQIASQGHNHISVEKKSTLKQTKINLTTLSRKERVEEIARMLGGVKITKQTRASAEEMLGSVL